MEKPDTSSPTQPTPNELMRHIITQLGVLKTGISLIESATLSSLHKSSTTEESLDSLRKDVARLRIKVEYLEAFQRCKRCKK